MPREHYNRPIQNAAGDLLVNSTVRLISKTTGQNSTVTIYKGETGGDTWENPWIAVDGVVDFWLDQPGRYRLGVTPPSQPEKIFDIEVGDEETYYENFTFSASGSQKVKAYGTRFYLDAQYVVEKIRISVGTAPTGADLIADVNLNGVSVFASQAARPRIVAGQNVGSVTPTNLVVNVDQYLTVDVDQVGSTEPGADIVVQIRMRRIS